MLAQHKIGEIAQQKQQNAYNQLGLSPGLAQLDPTIQNSIIKSQLENNPGMLSSQADPLSSMYQQLSPSFQERFRNETGYNPVQRQQPTQSPGVSKEATGLESLLGDLGRPVSPKAQAQNNALGKDLVKGMKVARDNAEAAITAIQNMRELDATGKVLERATGYRPTWLQSSETAEYDKESNRLAGLLVEGQRGVPGLGKIKFALTQKPNISMPKQARNRILDNLEKEAQKVLKKAELSKEIIQLNNHQIPSDLDGRIEGLYDLYKKQGMTEQQAQAKAQNKVAQEQQQEGPFKPYNADDESVVGYGLRQGIRGAARIGGAVAGLPGDLASAASGVASYLTGGAIPSLDQLAEKYPVLKSLPTSENIKRGLGNITGGYTNPQSEVDQGIDNIIETAAAIFGPNKARGLAKGAATAAGASAKTLEAGRKAAKVILPFSGTAVPVSRALKYALAGEAGSMAAESAGAGPIGQAAGKLGFMMFAGLPDMRKDIQNLGKQTFAEAETMGSKLNTNINNTIKEVEGLKSAYKRDFLPHQADMNVIYDEVIDGLKANPNGKANIASLMKSRAGLSKRQGWDTPGFMQTSKATTEEALRDPIAKIKNVIDKAIEKGSKRHPEFQKKFAEALDIHRGLKYESAFSKWLSENKKIPGGITASPTKILMKKGLGAMIEIFERYPRALDLMKQPVVKDHFWKFIQNAAENNSRAAIVHLKQLDKAFRSVEG